MIVHMGKFLPITLVLLTATFAIHAQNSAPPCSLKFSIATKDSLGNVDSGLGSGDQKWLEKNLRLHYQGMCYVPYTPDIQLIFLIAVSNQTETIVPRVITYPIYTLKIVNFHDGKTDVLRTFQRAMSGRTRGGVPGIVASLKNPERDVIYDAVNWLANADLPDNMAPKSR